MISWFGIVDFVLFLMETLPPSSCGSSEINVDPLWSNPHWVSTVELWIWVWWRFFFNDGTISWILEQVRSSSPHYIGEYLHPRTLSCYDDDDDGVVSGGGGVGVGVAAPSSRPTSRPTSRPSSSPPTPLHQHRWNSASPKGDSFFFCVFFYRVLPSFAADCWWDFNFRFGQLSMLYRRLDWNLMILTSFFK